jgi:hypothetical protein
MIVVVGVHEVSPTARDFLSRLRSKYSERFGVVSAAFQACVESAIIERPGGSIKAFCEPAIYTSTVAGPPGMGVVTHADIPSTIVRT